MTISLGVTIKQANGPGRLPCLTTGHGASLQVIASPAVSTGARREAAYTSGARREAAEADTSQETPGSKVRSVVSPYRLPRTIVVPGPSGSGRTFLTSHLAVLPHSVRARIEGTEHHFASHREPSTS